MEDVAAFREFYQDLFGLRKLAGDDRFCAFAAPRKRRAAAVQEGRNLAACPDTGRHDSRPRWRVGQSHFAFKISADRWQLASRNSPMRGVAIESSSALAARRNQLVFSRSRRHLVELITPGCWEVY